MSRPNVYPAELRQRAVRMVAEVRPNYESEWAAIGAVAQKLGIGTAETLRKWVRQAEINAGARAGVTSEEAAEIKRLRRCRRRAAPGQRDPQGSLCFLRGRTRPATATLVRFIDEHRKVFTVESICRVLSEHGWAIASSTYRAAVHVRHRCGSAATTSSRPPSPECTRTTTVCSARARSGWSLTGRASWWPGARWSG